MGRYQERSNRESDREWSDTAAAADQPIDPTLPLRPWHRIGIRWRHRAEWNPEMWGLRVRFDELIAANQWDLAANVDELNDRYRHH